jgi:thymidine kinase
MPANQQIFFRLPIILVKPVVDTKSGNNISSRLGVERAVDLLIASGDCLYERFKSLGGPVIECVLADEAQFFEESHVLDMRRIVDDFDIPVIAYGLRTDFQRKAFAGSVALFELADNIEAIRTVCSCMKSATFNARVIGDRMVFEGDQVVIDGDEDAEGSRVDYVPLCSSCYTKAQNSPSTSTLGA